MQTTERTAACKRIATAWFEETRDEWDESEVDAAAAALMNHWSDLGITPATATLALTAEEVQVAFGWAESLGKTRLAPLSEREQALAERMRLMLGCTADGERR